MGSLKKFWPKKLNSKGVSIIEVIVTTGLITTLYYGYLSNVVWVNKQNQLMASKGDISLLRENIVAIIKDNNSFVNTINDRSNSSMKCLVDETDCTGQSGSLLLKDGADNTVVDALNSRSGFTKNGEICNDFDANNGNDHCPYKVNLTWRPLCQAGNCINPLLEIKGEFIVKANSSGAVPIANLSRLNIYIIRESLKQPVLIESVSSAVDKSQTCSVITGNQVKCWGANDDGGLGLGHRNPMGGTPATIGNNLPFVDLGSGRTAKQVTNGIYFSCAILDNDLVKCWGANGWGQLGYGDRRARGDNPGEMGDNLPYVNLGTGRTAVSLSSRGVTVCALLDNSQMKCWGGNGEGELGYGDLNDRGDNPSEMGDSLPFINVGTGKSVKNMCTGSRHTCAILNDDTLKCWGAGLTVDGATYGGMLGQGNVNDLGGAPNQMGDNLPVVNLGAGRTVKDVSCGAYHTCAILDNNNLKCWGANEFGQLGYGDTNPRGDNAGEMGDSLPAVNLGAGKWAKYISSGIFHTCAILNDDTLKCWGGNQYGGLGLGHLNAIGDNPGEMGDNLSVVNVDPTNSPNVVLAGYYYTCALLSNKRLKCWGGNMFGESGVGNRRQYGDAPGEMGSNLPYTNLGSQ